MLKIHTQTHTQNIFTHQCTKYLPCNLSAVTIPVAAACVCLPLCPALLAISVWFHSALSFSPPLPAPSHLHLSLPACFTLLFFCFYRPLCFPTGLGWELICVTSRQRRLQLKPTSRKGRWQASPQKGGCTCVCVCWLIFYERVERERHRKRGREGVVVYVIQPKSRGDWQLGKPTNEGVKRYWKT